MRFNMFNQGVAKTRSRSRSRSRSFGLKPGAGVGVKTTLSYFDMTALKFCVSMENTN